MSTAAAAGAHRAQPIIDLPEGVRFAVRFVQVFVALFAAAALYGYAGRNPIEDVVSLAALLANPLTWAMAGGAILAFRIFKHPRHPQPARARRGGSHRQENVYARTAQR